ncbi:MAG: glucosidase [Akkermansiaceae bacterium]|nr:glucosidase [Armatimonadota bacterium]
MNIAESARIAASANNPDGWRLWGPYLSERAWGTVREDYSADGSAWDYFPHDHARSRAYRWNEDGLGGISDIRQDLCFAVGLWNGVDPILKERMFGLTGTQGNHGEDVKEYYYYLDATPTASYLKFLYKYPQSPFPYSDLVDGNAKRSRSEWEYELLDTGVFRENRYFDVFVEYAKAGADDICIRITAHNRGPESAPLHLLPTLWFRNTWSWEDRHAKPKLRRAEPLGDASLIVAEHTRLGTYHLYAEAITGDGPPQLLFTENETNNERIFRSPNASPFTKDGIHEAIIGGNNDAVNELGEGTKVAAAYRADIAAGQSVTLHLRLRKADDVTEAYANADRTLFGNDFSQTFTDRIAEADAFYERFTHPTEGGVLSDDARNVQRQAFAGLIWSKQFYHYDVAKWLRGDPLCPPPPQERNRGRNQAWTTFSVADVLSMPDKWEYPWFAAWDLAFHMIPFAQIDPDFAKHQLLMLCREWYMHPSGQLPAYEWAFGDVNPPVHAWAALRVYKIERRAQGKKRGEPGDTNFLKRIFHKLLLNFTWWVNQKDEMNNNVFEGGFLGLDNIGVFDRSAPLPLGGTLEQADGTAWMAMYCLNMLAIALELARVDRDYEDVATKFAEHYVYIAYAMNSIGENHLALWDEEDGFYYDLLHIPRECPEQRTKFLPLKVRSWVGIMPLFAVEAFDADTLASVPGFRRRFEWFLKHRPELAKGVAHIGTRGKDDRALFSLVAPDRLKRVLRRALDEQEFLSPYGIRSLSRHHDQSPYRLNLESTDYSVEYNPAESVSNLFGGNSNWRGPIWFPLNYLLIESLQKFDYVYGDLLKVEMPTGSGNEASLWDVSVELSRRLNHLYLRDEHTGKRAAYGGIEAFQNDPHFRDFVLFYEYFHGDNGAGLGASHQTGWTALIAKTLSQSGE